MAMNIFSLQLPEQPARGLPTIDMLPVELLIKVFVCYAHTVAMAPLTLCRVCRRWKAITENNACLFQLVMLDDSQLSIGESSRASLVFLEHTNELEFDIDVNLSSCDSLLPILSPYLHTLHRWRSFTSHGILNKSLHFRSFWDSDVMKPKLEELQIKILNHADVDVIVNDVSETARSRVNQDTDLFRKCSTSLTSNNLCMSIALTKLPLPRLLTPLQIVTLTISEDSIAHNIHPADLLHFLTACPMLQYLYLEGSMATPIFTKDNQLCPPPVACLRHLRSLTLRKMFCTRIILSHLDTPNLEELFLEHLGVDLAFPVLSPYLPCDHELEDGDSDDEWPDLSPSSYSDRATGMGVRNLLRHSNPPLRVIEMDCANMRVKDFRWLFEHAHDLEDFRVVASEVADRVIAMLGPLLVPARPNVHAPVVSEDPDGTRYVHHVMLPHLKSIMLSKCRRLSGTAIVQAVAQRAVVMDSLVRCGITDFFLLEDVAVLQCPRFTAEHGAELEAKLGERVRFD